MHAGVYCASQLSATVDNYVNPFVSKGLGQEFLEHAQIAAFHNDFQNPLGRCLLHERIDGLVHEVRMK